MSTVLQTEIIYLESIPSLPCLCATNTDDALSRCELVFENCFVPEENVLGKEGKGSAVL